MTGTVRKAIATVSVSGTLEEKLAAIAAAGFDGVEIFENDLVNSFLSPQQVRHLATDLGLRVELYQPLRDVEAVPADLFARNLRRAERKFDVMEQLGADLLLVCSNVSPVSVDDDALAASQLQQLAERAQARGIRVAYEALAWGRHVHDYRKSYAIVAAADHPALGVCLDSFHILSRGADPAGIAAIPAEKLFFLQVADAPLLAMDVLQWSRHYRCFPGQGAFDLTGFVRQVVQAGYRGPLSLEVFNDVFRQIDCREASVDAMRSLLFLEESLPDPERPAPSRDTVRLASLPAPAEVSDVAFVELDVPEASLSDCVTVLQALGFTRRGRHRSKPVELWHQGAARLVLNYRPGDRTGPALSTIGLYTDSVARFAQRAAAFIAGPAPRQRGAGEADLPSVRCPDGSVILACEGDAWLSDFLPAGGETDDAGLLRRVDHVALSVPFGLFDETVLLCRAVLGLQPTGSVELADPYGMIQSRAVASRGEGVRIALNVAQPSHRGAGPRPRHVAFACDDLLATAAALRTREVSLLPIPDNYYDDLQARYELPDALVASLRAYGVLYDASEAGEFFHLYTDLVGPGLFFEFVQRVGGYAGYGAANAPTRMAAQLRRATMAPARG